MGHSGFPRGDCTHMKASELSWCSCLGHFSPHFWRTSSRALQPERPCPPGEEQSSLCTSTLPSSLLFSLEQGRRGSSVGAGPEPAKQEDQWSPHSCIIPVIYKQDQVRVLSLAFQPLYVLRIEPSPFCLAHKNPMIGPLNSLGSLPAIPLAAASHLQTSVCAGPSVCSTTTLIPLNSDSGSAVPSSGHPPSQC